MGAAIGAAVRRSAGAIGVYVAVVFLLPLVLAKASEDLARLTPLMLLANSIAAVVHQTESVSPVLALVLFTSYTAAIIVLAAVVVSRRDP